MMIVFYFDATGWRYSRLVDVIVHSDLSPTERTNKNTAVLVHSDGCNNQDYLVNSLIAANATKLSIAEKEKLLPIHLTY